MRLTLQKQARSHKLATVKEEEEGEPVLVGLVPGLNQGQTPKLRGGDFRHLPAITPEPIPSSVICQKAEDGVESSHKGLLPLTPKSIEPKPRSNPLTETPLTDVLPMEESSVGEDIQQYLQDGVRTSIETDGTPSDVDEIEGYFPGEHDTKEEDEPTFVCRGIPVKDHLASNKRKLGLLDDDAQDRNQKRPRHFSHHHGRNTREKSLGESVSETHKDKEDDAYDETESDLETDQEVADGDYDALDHWRREQIVLNAVLKGRDEFSLLPSTWRIHFHGAPVSGCMFYRQTKGMAARPRIYSHEDRYEVRGMLK